MIVWKMLQICLLWHSLRKTPINFECVSYSDFADKIAMGLPDELVANGQI